MAGTIEEMPIRNLTDDEIDNLFCSTRRHCIEHLENNGFNKLFREYIFNNHDQGSNSNRCRYYDTNEFITDYKNSKQNLSVFHINIR